MVHSPKKQLLEIPKSYIAIDSSGTSTSVKDSPISADDPAKYTSTFETLDPSVLNSGSRFEVSPTSSRSDIGSRVDILLGTRSPRSLNEVTNHQDRSNHATDLLVVSCGIIVLISMVMSIVVFIYSLATIGL